MDILADKANLHVNRQRPFLAVLQTARSIVRWLAGLVILNDEDRKKAGIYFGGEGRDG
jgi:hypothetical protein